MQLQKVRIGNKEVMPFTIPSGIIMTEPSCAVRLLKMIPEIGIWSTKTITLEARLGFREPIVAQLDYSLGTFVNAVGLTNPGAEEFARRLAQVKIPEDRVILASIAGKDADEFVQVAKILEDRIDSFELNLSCPHVQGHGMQLGQDARLVYEIVRSVVQATKKPVFAKLTPQAINIGEIAKAAINAGAYGIVAINTVGPGEYSVDGHPVLSNRVGGISGKSILPIGLRCVREIRQAIGPKPVIISMGGISVARDAVDYFSLRANAVGIGTGLAGMDDIRLQKYFPIFVEDVKQGTNFSSDLLEEIDMRYQKVRVRKNQRLASDLKIIETDYSLRAEPGQFVFAWIPEVGEKPFSVMEDEPFLTLGVLERGCFTNALGALKGGDSFYVRGPYGRGVEVPPNSNVVLVGGGCGIAGLALLAKRFSLESNVLALLAAKDAQHLPYLDRFRESGQVEIATEDGSLGRKGVVTDLFDEIAIKFGTYFYNCGPAGMINAILPLELALTKPEMIYSSQDFLTKCGVGLCGGCVDRKGQRTCVEGTFLPVKKR